MGERLDDSKYAREPGRPKASEYYAVECIANILADKLDADLITVLGAAAGVFGTYGFGFPERAAKFIEDLSNGFINPPKGRIRLFGLLALTVSYICDILDGAVSRKSSRGETKHGKVIDGTVNKLVDTSLAVYELTQDGSLVDKSIWLAYAGLAPVSTMIRSRGLAHDVPIPKTGWGARIGRLPFVIGALASEDHHRIGGIRVRDLFGVALNAQLLYDSKHRYDLIRKSGNQQALREVHRDLAEYSLAFLAGRLSSSRPKPREAITLGLELAKLTSVKIKEAFK